MLQANNDHNWSFSTVGGVKRVNIDKAEDLIHLAALDPKLWTALSCPAANMEIDKKTLDLIDTDGDGQIRVPEILAAVKWVIAVLKDPADLLKESADFPLSAINDSTELGKTLLESARVVLKNIGKESGTSLTVEETSDTTKIFAGSGFNGDGIITEDSTTHADLLQLISEVILHTGSATDRGGKQGIHAEHINTFFDHCEKYAAWIAQCNADKANILPLADNTQAAYSNYSAIKAKVDDYFIRCRLAAFDKQSTEVLNLQVARVESITAKNLAECADEIGAYPLARIEAGKPLPVTTGINPTWEAAIATFRQLTVSAIYGADKATITESEWQAIGNTFAPFAAWQAAKQGTLVESLGIDRIQAIIGGQLKNKLLALIDQDNALTQDANNIIQVDKLVRYHRDLYTLLKNFVTFFDFYSPDYKAMFQAGTLYIDQRSLDLCIKVTDMGRHNSLASFSGMYLIYCDCVSRTSKEKISIVAALTNGDIDNLMVGRNALFYDRHGVDWDATITKIIDNPISIRQAFFSPYRKVSVFIEKQINKMAASEDEKISAGLNKGVENIPVKVDETAAKKEPPKPFDVGKFVGIFAAIGLALGAIGTAITSVVSGFMKLEWWKMPLAIAGLLLLISGPSMVIAYLKLRKRNLAPILDANGWAVNANIIINIQFGNTLTHLAELPRGAKINFNDPFKKKNNSLLPTILFLSVLAGAALFLLFKYGVLHLK